MKYLFAFVCSCILLPEAWGQANLDWQRNIGGSGDDYCRAVSVVGSYRVMVGSTTSADGDIGALGTGNQCGCMVALSADGSVSKICVVSQFERSEFTGLAPTTDSGFIAVGTCYQPNSIDGVPRNHDLWVVKFDKDFSVTWKRNFGGTEDEYGRGVVQTADGGFIAVGSTSSANLDVSGLHGRAGFTTDAWIVKLDSTGALLWQKCIGGSGIDDASSVAELSSGTLIVAGTTSSTDGDIVGSHGGKDILCALIDPTGALQMCRSFGSEQDEELAGMAVSGQGSVYLASTVSQFRSVRVDAIDTSLAPLWDNAYGGSLNNAASSITCTSTGKIILAGTTETLDRSADTTARVNHACLRFLSATGDVLTTWLAPDSGQLTTPVVARVREGVYFVGGSIVNQATTHTNSPWDLWGGEFSGVLESPSAIRTNELAGPVFQTYPNPCRNVVTVDPGASQGPAESTVVNFYAADGTLVHRETIFAGRSDIALPQALTKGAYWMVLNRAGTLTYAQLVIVQ